MKIYVAKCNFPNTTACFWRTEYNSDVRYSTVTACNPTRR
jgi:hypothetical protein